MKFFRSNRINNVKNFYKDYTKDFNVRDIEKFFKEDAPEVYDFYVRRMKNSARGNSIPAKLRFLRNLFIEFLMQLSPERRFVYTIALISFVMGYFGGNLNWMAISFILLNILIAFELADKLTAKDELEVAREIQSSLMPKESPSNKFYDICGYSESAREVGGDYFDFIFSEKDPEKMYLIIGDISGKGMAAAIHMVQVRSVLHYIISSHESPKEILTALNTNLKKVLRAGSFFTASLACMDSTSEMSLCRAGHLPLIHYSRKNETCNNIIPYGMGIGLGNQYLFEKTLEEITITPEPGDIFVFYTDGIIEAMNEYLQEYGEGRLINVIKQNAYKPAVQIKDSILASVRTFTNIAPRHDDITMIIMKAI